jgi:hypothetical protein
MQTMYLLTGVAIQPNLELKTRPKPVLGSLPLAFALPDWGVEDFKRVARKLMGESLEVIWAEFSTLS